ncbi:CPBP family intramembrane glutamic endopeptidase [uncultured Polaribacter sp.]|uniref:CPBP family intramembrane glutamic endopeptidase n=1 Tax=uncultured Polaribacter sp. TaxID=174711 RepID=UPI002605379C|nr:CPBP family intramembrane glutamic endopeptidase [uncultured Polaribacter sp.]
MKQTLNTLLGYIKNPVLEKDTNQNINYRLNIFFHLLLLSLITGIVISPLFALLEMLNLIDLDTHKIQEMFTDMSNLKIFLFVVVLAPLIEETIFRAPLTLFKNKIAFKNAFYIFAIMFGFVHISNFEITTNVILLSPLLVLPQALLGLYLGFIRVRFGLIWAMLLHAAYNGILISVSFLE